MFYRPNAVRGGQISDWVGIPGDIWVNGWVQYLSDGQPRIKRCVQNFEKKISGSVFLFESLWPLSLEHIMPFKICYTKKKSSLLR